MSNINYFLISFAVLIIAIGQIIFKLAAKNIQIDLQKAWVETLLQNALPIGLVCSALALYFLSTIAWVQALRTVPLSVAFMFNSLAFIIVPCAGFFLFNETVPRYFFIGMPLILVGIYLVTRP